MADTASFNNPMNDTDASIDIENSPRPVAVFDSEDPVDKAPQSVGLTRTDARSGLTSHCRKSWPICRRPSTP